MNDQRRPQTKFEWAHDNFEFDQWPFYNMSRLILLYHRRLDAVLKPSGIDTSRWRVLSILGKRETATVTQIADEAATLLTTTAKLVRRMVKQGLVVTNTSSADARSVEVSLTAAGRSMLAATQRKVDSVAFLSFLDIPVEDLDKLNAVTRQMHGNLKL